MERLERSAKLILATFIVLGAPIATADKLSDFKDAVGRAGCESIPYSSLQSDCKSQRGNLHDYCDGGRGPVSCVSQPNTRELKNSIDKEQRAVQALKEKKRKLEDEKYRASDEKEKNRLANEIAQVERDLYEAGKRVDKAVADLEARKKHVSNAIYTIEKCLDYRRAVMNVFATAIDKVRGETDKDIVPLARELRRKYEESKSGHQRAITEKDNALRHCKDERP